MSSKQPPLRDMLIRQAEGYLDLVNACSDCWESAPEIRDPLVYRALDALSRLSRADQDLPHVLYLTGQAFRTMELYHDAIPPLTNSADRDPSCIHVWLALGWCYKRIGRLDRAIESLEEALTADPGQAIVHYNLACYWSLAGTPEVALAYLANALDIDEAYRELVYREPDFDPIREHPLFREMTSVVV